MYNQFPPPNQYWQQQPPEPPKEKVMDLWKIVGINFGVFMMYQVLFVFIADDAFLIADILPLCIHWLVMFILMIVGFSRGRKMHGLGHLISLLSIIVIGFGSCWWIADALGSSFH
jgi:hypothetical protein